MVSGGGPAAAWVMSKPCTSSTVSRKNLSIGSGEDTVPEITAPNPSFDSP